MATCNINKQPMGCDAQLARTGGGMPGGLRRGISSWGTCGENSRRELSRGKFPRDFPDYVLVKCRGISGDLVDTNTDTDHLYY